MAQYGGDRICNGSFVKQNYNGPPFNESDWRFIAGNYVREDGYEYGIWCHQQSGYTIDVHPLREKQDGSKKFCTDETGRLGCEAKWIPFRVSCQPCEK